MKRLIEQTACEHGKWTAHPNNEGWKYCPGGSSREVTVDYEAATFAAEAEAKKWPVEDHPLGWVTRTPPSGASMAEVAKAAVDAALGGGW